MTNCNDYTGACGMPCQRLVKHNEGKDFGATEGTRTPTPLRVHGPEPCASANSATMAKSVAGRPSRATFQERTTTNILQAHRWLSNQGRRAQRCGQIISTIPLVPDRHPSESIHSRACSRLRGKRVSLLGSDDGAQSRNG